MKTPLLARRDVLRGALALLAVTCAAPLWSRAAFAQAALTAPKFDARETAIVRDYYRMQVEKARANRGKGGGVPPGLPRKDELAPGLANAIRPGRPLPSSVPKKGLPQDLEGSLPARYTMARLIAGDKVMLVDAKGLVRDVIEITDILDRLYRN